MSFNSIEFLFFLPLVFFLYWIPFRRKGKTWQNVFIIFASYVFYGWWDIRFLGLIAFTTLCSYLSGKAIEKSSKKIWWLWGNTLVNIGILVIFKYFDFFSKNLSIALEKIGFPVDIVTLNLVLPIGISFYTFQALGYTIDVYRNKLKPTDDIIAFFSFLSFFPQLVAGPIERASTLLPQFQRKRNFSYTEGVDGLRLILWGMFKKLVVADNCGAVVDMIFSNFTHYGGEQLFIGAVLFSFQIYGDFSGYSDMAVGIAKLFGIELTANFHTPYFSKDISEFWRRWHISLTTWFRDYVYIPLGGSHVNKTRVVRNITVVFLLSGLWHGADWSFIAWGVYNAALFVPIVMIGKKDKPTSHIATDKMSTSVRNCILIMSTFVLVTIGWVFFRSIDLESGWVYIKRMFLYFNLTTYFHGKQALFWSLIMLMIEWKQRSCRFGLDFSNPSGLIVLTPVRWSIYIAIILVCMLFTPNNSGEFIYFQF